jgi:hypothetical protein
VSKALKIRAGMEKFLQKHDVSVEYGSGKFYGGACTLNESMRIVLNRHIPVEEQISILAKSFWDMEINLEGLQSPALDFVMKFAPNKKPD